MITPINIALLGVVLAAVALVILRRRRSGATHEAVSDEMPDETMTTVDEPVAPVQDDVFSKHVWSEAAATMTPVREDEAVAVADADDDPDDEPELAFEPENEPELAFDLEEEPELTFENEDEAETPDVVQEADEAPEAGADDLDRPEAEHDEDTGEIPELELEDMTDPDDGLGEIITDPGWYLPGETDMTRGSPSTPSRSLIPQDDLALSGGLVQDADLPAEAPSALLADDEVDFSAAAPWAGPAENGAEAAELTWLGLADEEAAAAAVEQEVTFDMASSPSDDLFELPPMDEGISEDRLAIGTPPALERWEAPPAPIAPLLNGSAPADVTVAQHGPLTVSFDPAALLAMETEEIKRSTSQSDGAVSWELTLKVELRQRDNDPGKAG